MSQVDDTEYPDLHDSSCLNIYERGVVLPSYRVVWKLASPGFRAPISAVQLIITKEIRDIIEHIGLLLIIRYIYKFHNTIYNPLSIWP